MKTSITEMRKNCILFEILLNSFFRVQNFRNFWEIVVLLLKMVLHENFHHSS